MPHAYRVTILRADGSTAVDETVGLDPAVTVICDHHELHANSLRTTLQDLHGAGPGLEIAIPAALGGGGIRVRAVAG